MNPTDARSIVTQTPETSSTEILGAAVYVPSLPGYGETMPVTVRFDVWTLRKIDKVGRVKHRLPRVRSHVIKSAVRYYLENHPEAIAALESEG